MGDNMEVRIGVVGLGNIGKFHCSYINEIEGAQLVAVCDKDKKKLNDTSIPKDFDLKVGNFSEVLNGVSKYTDYKEMIRSGEVDLIIISVPHYFHPDIAIEAFHHKIHVICEKPVAVSSRDALRMNEVAQKSNVVFSVMFQKRVSPVNLKIHEIIKKGVLGQIIRINWIITDFFRTQKYYDSGGWRGTWKEEGGGVLINQCPHYLDLFQWFFGLPKKLSSLVYLDKWHNILVEDDVSVLMEMENGASASFITTTGDYPGTNRLEITGSKGKLVYEHEENITLYLLKKPLPQIIKNSEEGFYSVAPSIKKIKIKDIYEGHKYITQNTINAILKNEKLISPGIDGIKSVQLANSILYSGLMNKQIQFPVSDDLYIKLLETLKEKETI